MWPLLLSGALATLLIWRPTDWELLVVEAGVLASCAVLLLKSPEQQGARSRAVRHALIAFAALPCLGVLQSCFSISAMHHPTVRSSLTWLAAACVLRSAYMMCRDSGIRKRALSAVAAFGSALCLVSILQFFTSQGRIFWLWASAEPQVFGPFHSRNNYASFALLMFPLLVWQGINRNVNWYYLTAGAFVGASIVSSGSRAGAALFALEVVALCFLMRKTRCGTRVMAPFAVLLGVIIVAAGWSQLSTKLLDHDPFRYRREMLVSTLEMWRQKPVLGFGLGTFTAVYPSYAQFDSGHYVNHAHNDWAEMAAEGGLAGTLFLAVFAGVTGVAALRNLWGLGVPAVFLHGLVDFPLQRPGVLFWLLILSGALLAENNVAFVKRRSWWKVTGEDIQ
ncbi:MAG: O-antigen ligase family protein [Bryobacterales bacterium]|nr:O-antigen ligase family protein [Bryobacterales bacterium]